MRLVSQILGLGGPFSKQLEHFQPRDVQQKMATEIADAIEHAGVLVVESGTGTGKTFAYLVPALMSGQKVLISTGTRHLQDQLFKKDLPLVSKVLGIQPKAALLKGRSNYLCLHRLESARQNSLFKDEQSSLIEKIARWANESDSGDLGEFIDLEENSSVRINVTSTSDNCLGNRCPDYDDCFVSKARKDAQEADVLVVNHHLFCADLVLKEEGFGQLLPGVDVCIFDEAHQLPDVASVFLGKSMGSRQLNELISDIQSAESEEKSQVKGLASDLHALHQAVHILTQELVKHGNRYSWYEVINQPQISNRIDATMESLLQLEHSLQQAAVTGEKLTRCWARCQGLIESWAEFQELREGGQWISWVETGRRSFRIHQTPLDIGNSLASHLYDRNKTWVFTSATLAVNNSFSYYRNLIGIGECSELQLASPFDFSNQTLLFLPDELPDPRSQGFTEIMLDTISPVLKASKGRAFLLFTSHRALQIAARLFKAQGRYQLFIQGDMPKQQLIEEFQVADNAVLLGTASFWEGVDVRGDALSCVIIDKLPFAAINDPVMKARLRAIEEDNGNPFMEYQVPNAVINLKQGSGRLIRDITDRGVLVLCDPRISTKAYGRIFLRSLPEMPVTRKMADVEKFFQSAL